MLEKIPLKSETFNNLNDSVLQEKNIERNLAEIVILLCITSFKNFLISFESKKKKDFGLNCHTKHGAIDFFKKKFGVERYKIFESSISFSSNNEKVEFPTPNSILISRKLSQLIHLTQFPFKN